MVPCDTGFGVISPLGGFLEGRGANWTSQFGEDGLIEAALELYGAVNQWCFEVGASDGLFFSNTARLRNNGWNCVLIEGDAERYEKLRLIASERVHTVPKRIGPRSLDQILTSCGAPIAIDFGVIDIDGQDYWVWDGLREHRPRMILIEFDYGSESDGAYVPSSGGAGQASFASILELGREKDYTALAKTACNLLFVANEVL